MKNCSHLQTDTKDINVKSYWRVLYTIPRNEKKVYTELSKKKLEAYLPLTKVTRQWRDRKKRLEVPLFPNYLFAKITDKELWQVSSINGVVKLIRFDGKVAVISDEEIDSIRTITNEGHEVRTENLSISAGKRIKVRVTCGPFKGMEGITIDSKSNNRLYIELKMINQVVSVDISEYHLEKVTEPY